MGGGGGGHGGGGGLNIGPGEALIGGFALSYLGAQWLVKGVRVLFKTLFG